MLGTYALCFAPIQLQNPALCCPTSPDREHRLAGWKVSWLFYSSAQQLQHLWRTHSKKYWYLLFSTWSIIALRNIGILCCTDSFPPLLLAGMIWIGSLCQRTRNLLITAHLCVAQCFKPSAKPCYRVAASQKHSFPLKNDLWVSYKIFNCSLTSCFNEILLNHSHRFQMTRRSHCPNAPRKRLR